MAMRVHLANLWEDISTSLWSLPALIMAAVVVLAWALLNLDRALGPAVARQVPWLFGGTADAAATLLSAIARSIITVATVVFSVTMVAVERAASQYSPRVLRTFIRDRVNQIVLGTNIATFLYTVLVMGQVRSEEAVQPAFVPVLSVSIAIVLTFISVALLVYFIHHSAQSLRVETLLSALGKEMAAETNALFPGTMGRAATEPPTYRSLLQDAAAAHAGIEREVHSARSGYVRRIDEELLAEAVRGSARAVAVQPRPGDFVLRGSLLARVWAEAPPSPEQVERLRGAIVLAADRTVRQDLMYGLAQVVDVAVKALSPAERDTTTAEQCLMVLGDTMARVTEREIPSSLWVLEGGTHILFNRHSFADYVDASFGEVRRAATGDVHATLALLGVLEELAWRVPTAERALPVREQVEQVLAGMEGTTMLDADRAAVRARARAVLDVLARRPRAGEEAA